MRAGQGSGYIFALTLAAVWGCRIPPRLSLGLFTWS